MCGINYYSALFYPLRLAFVLQCGIGEIYGCRLSQSHASISSDHVTLNDDDVKYTQLITSFSSDSGNLDLYLYVVVQSALSSICGRKMEQLNVTVKQPLPTLNSLIACQPVVDFLNGAGQIQLVSQVCNL